LARILGYASHAHEPEWFTTAPGGAIRKVLKQVDWQAGGVDLFEINEAFAVVTMAAMVDVEMDHEQVNVNAEPAHWAPHRRHWRAHHHHAGARAAQTAAGNGALRPCASAARGHRDRTGNRLMSDSVLYGVDGRGIATVTLNRPDKHNAFDAAMLEALHRALETANADRAVRPSCSPRRQKFLQWCGPCRDARADGRQRRGNLKMRCS